MPGACRDVAAVRGVQRSDIEQGGPDLTLVVVSAHLFTRTRDAGRLRNWAFGERSEGAASFEDVLVAELAGVS